MKPNRQLFTLSLKLFETMKYPPIFHVFSYHSMISGRIEICIIYMNGFLNLTLYDRKILKACISPCKLWIEGWSACPCRHNMQWNVCNLILKFPWKSNEVRNYTKINKNVKLHCKIHSMANSITYCIYY